MPTHLVTGSNRGIGLALCRELRARGDDVVAVCRERSRALEALGARVEEGVDVRSDEAVAALGSRLAGTRLDTLILNAGILRRDGLDALDLRAVREQLEVNAIGPLRVVAALRPLLSRGSKVALVTSRMGSIEDNTSGGYYGYRMSKAALNAAGKSLSLDLAPAGVAVVVLHPGFVQTDMTGHAGDVTAAVAASRLLARIDELTLERTGRFVHASGEPLPW